jgi:hypothetical protein
MPYRLAVVLVLGLLTPGGANKTWALGTAHGDSEAHVSREDDFNWFTFIIGSSCLLETILPNGTFDNTASNLCGECFDSAEANYEEIFTNCSVAFLPNITAQCVEVMEEVGETMSFDWDTVLGCFYSYVAEMDGNWIVQTAVKEWMDGQQDLTKEWEFVIGASCLVESKTGWAFDYDRAKQCGNCFEEMTDRMSGMDEEELWAAEVRGVESCTEEFLPHMKGCPTLLAAGQESKALGCFRAKLEALDYTGEVGLCLLSLWLFAWVFLPGLALTALPQRKRNIQTNKLVSVYLCFCAGTTDDGGMADQQ